MDQNLAHMYMMDSKSRAKVYLLRKHYVKMVVSSGLKEMIEGIKVAAKFKRIYASSFYFGKNEVAVWTAQIVNDTNKTQFLFRIEKVFLT